MLPINQLLHQGRYKIIQPLGQNGSGLLYEAQDNILQSKVVLKEIIVKLGKVATAAQQENIKLAFSDEAEKLKKINHEAFLPIRDYFSEIDRHYLVSDTNNELNLKELLEKKGSAFSYSEVIKWTEQLLDALNYLHSQMPAIIHRDIKPQNLRLTADGKIKLSSPGISNKLSGKINKTETNQSSSTANLHFLPLEQIWESLDSASQKVITNSYDEKSEEILKQPTDAASDIYSLAATIYYLLTAQPPIDALERSIDILEGKADPLPSPSQLNPAVPPEISNILMKALEIKRENRFSLTLIMRQVLRTAVLQIKEREAEQEKEEEIREEEEALQELRLAEQRRIDKEREIIEQKARELEAEQKRLENERLLIEQRKQEIEAERKRQEKLTVRNQHKEEEAKSGSPKASSEVETDFFDDDILELGEQKSASSIKKDVASVSVPVYAANETAKAETAKADQSSAVLPDESGDLFADSHKSGGGFWKIPAIAVALLVFGGAGFGIWYSQQKGAEMPAQTAPVQAVSATEPPKETSPATPITPENQTAATVTETAPPNAPANELNQTQTTAATAKTKTAATPLPKPKKQNTPPPQTAENQKKAVTVDDIINDN